MNFGAILSRFFLLVTLFTALVSCQQESEITSAEVASSSITSTSDPTQPPPTATVAAASPTVTTAPTETPTPRPTETLTPQPTETLIPSPTPNPTATPVDPQQLAQEAQQRLRAADSFFFSSEQILFFKDVGPPYAFKEQCRWQKPDKLHCFQIILGDIEEGTGNFQISTSEILSAGGIIWKNMGSMGGAPIEQSRAGDLGRDPAAFDIIGTTFVIATDSPVWEVTALEGSDPFPPFLSHEPHEAEGATQRPNGSVNGIKIYRIDFEVEKELLKLFTERPIPSLLHFDPPDKETAEVLLWAGVDDLLPRRISYLQEDPESSLEWRFEYGAFDEPYEFPDLPE